CSIRCRGATGGHGDALDGYGGLVATRRPSTVGPSVSWDRPGVWWAGAAGWAIAPWFFWKGRSGGGWRTGNCLFCLGMRVSFLEACGVAGFGHAQYVHAMPCWRDYPMDWRFLDRGSP